MYRKSDIRQHHCRNGKALSIEAGYRNLFWGMSMQKVPDIGQNTYYVDMCKHSRSQAWVCGRSFAGSGAYTDLVHTRSVYATTTLTTSAPKRTVEQDL